ncbi:MAG TPA: hybrid sensor histidine kinase/response regulator, partial [Actinobacteria bacterium]|nr:hybrid sensor histidine kinase/response regulator [Actinomycetes bacterium]HEX21260.1 hybrid sensor histidine kinase/response regulator [Actinomycetota bacterium]
IEVEDDGCGIDVDMIREVAVEKGLIDAQEAQNLSEREALFLIFKSGFSTSPIITNVSGRGVGLDVVRQNVEKLNGMINIISVKDKGTKFSISLPLTLTTSRALLANVGQETFAIPTSSIERILRIQHQEISSIAGKDAIKIGDEPISIVRLDQILELPAEQKQLLAHDKITVIVLGSAEKRIAFVVDGVVGEMEIVVKSLGKQLVRVRNVSGATILGTGKVVMILNTADLIRSAQKIENCGLSLVEAQKEKQTTRQILVVDDSITTRTLEKNILESVGFSVKLAKDGIEALEKLQKHKFDLIVSDVDMSEMNGLELTSKVKSNNRFADIPVVLVTALESDVDRERGIEVGADAYLVKSSFDQNNLIETVSQLI